MDQPHMQFVQMVVIWRFPVFAALFETYSVWGKGDKPTLSEFAGIGLIIIARQTHDFAFAQKAVPCVLMKAVDPWHFACQDLWYTQESPNALA